MVNGNYYSTEDHLSAYHIRAKEINIIQNVRGILDVEYWLYLVPAYPGL